MVRQLRCRLQPYRAGIPHTISSRWSITALWRQNMTKMVYISRRDFLSGVCIETAFWFDASPAAISGTRTAALGNFSRIASRPAHAFDNTILFTWKLQSGIDGHCKSNSSNWIKPFRGSQLCRDASIRLFSTRMGNESPSTVIPKVGLKDQG